MRALVVGLGHMGKIHRRALHDHLGYEVFAVDPDPATGADFRTLAEAHENRTYDVAAVAVPIPALVETAHQLIGTPHLLVEKPFAASAREADMLGAYLERRGNVCVGFAERFNPVVQGLHRRMVSGHLESVDKTWRRDRVMAARFTRWSTKPSTDVVLDLLTHDVDLARFLGIPLTRPVGDEHQEVCTFDAAANKPVLHREISVTAGAWTETFDLTAHEARNVTRLWHAFLMGQPVPRPVDAARAIREAREVHNRAQLAKELAA